MSKRLHLNCIQCHHQLPHLLERKKQHFLRCIFIIAGFHLASIEDTKFHLLMPKSSLDFQNCETFIFNIEKVWSRFGNLVLQLLSFEKMIT